MYNFPVGVLIDSFKFPMEKALKKAVELGADGFQMYATSGEHSPENMTSQKRKELLTMVNGNGIVLSAICGDLGRGFGNKELNPQLIGKSKRIMDLAKELETDIVTTHIGVVPSDKNHERYKIMQEACFELSRYADSLGGHFAIETGPETSATLKEFLDELGSTGVGVNLDPANLVMVTGDNPVVAVHNLKKYIVHTHAKDGIKIYDKDPEIIYGLAEEEMLADSSFEEMPLGSGSVDFPAYLKALEEIGYRGFLTIERECGDNPVRDIKVAFDFLKKIIREN